MANCEQHKKLLEFTCLNDNCSKQYQAICIDCFQEYHLGHIILKFDKIIQIMQEKQEKQKDDIDLNEQLVKSCERQIKRIKDIEILLNKIQKTIVKALDQYQWQIKMLMKELQEFHWVNEKQQFEDQQSLQHFLAFVQTHVRFDSLTQTLIIQPNITDEVEAKMQRFLDTAESSLNHIEERVQKSNELLRKLSSLNNILEYEITMPDFYSTKTSNYFNNGNTLNPTGPLFNSQAGANNNNQVANIEDNNNQSSFGFPGGKFLFFFEDYSRNMFYFDIENRHQKKCFSKLEMNIQFIFPNYHRFVITPDFQLFLTGGKNFEDKDESKACCVKKAYRLDLKNQNFIEIPNMLQAHGAHGITFMSGFIYIVGGLNQEGNLTDYCEKYCLSTGKWMEICPIDEPICGACLCSFNEQYIFKFGGFIAPGELCEIISRYSPINDKWEDIQFNSFYGPKKQMKQVPFRSFGYGNAVQINQQELLILGGVNENESAKRRVMLMHMEKNNFGHDEFNLYEDPNLKTPYQGVYFQNAIVQEGAVYCLQEIYSANKSYSESTKRIMKFEDMKWSIVNQDFL